MNRLKKISANKQAKIERRAYHKHLRQTCGAPHVAGSWLWHSILGRRNLMLKERHDVIHSESKAIRTIAFQFYFRWKSLYADSVRLQRDLASKGLIRPIGGDVPFSRQSRP